MSLGAISTCFLNTSRDGQPVPVKKKFPNIQPKLSLAQLEAVSPLMWCIHTIHQSVSEASTFQSCGKADLTCLLCSTSPRWVLGTSAASASPPSSAEGSRCSPHRRTRSRSGSVAGCDSAGTANTHSCREAFLTELLHLLYPQHSAKPRRGQQLTQLFEI